jgi:hypothetical protein
MASDVISELNRGVLPAADLRERLGVSPATLMRMVREAGEVIAATPVLRARTKPLLGNYAGPEVQTALPDAQGALHPRSLLSENAPPVK